MKNELNSWKASGGQPKDKMVALLTALLETVKQYPEPYFRFKIEVYGIDPKLKQTGLEEMAKT